MLTLTAPKRSLRPTNFGSAFLKLKGMVLTAEEQRAIECLRKVESPSVFGETIRNVFIDYSDDKARQFLGEALSQIVDPSSATLMYKILGYECYNAILNLKP